MGGEKRRWVVSFFILPLQQNVILHPLCLSKTIDVLKAAIVSIISAELKVLLNIWCLRRNVVPNTCKRSGSLRAPSLP